MHRILHLIRVITFVPRGCAVRRGPRCVALSPADMEEGNCTVTPGRCGPRPIAYSSIAAVDNLTRVRSVNHIWCQDTMAPISDVAPSPLLISLQQALSDRIPRVTSRLGPRVGSRPAAAATTSAELAATGLSDSLRSEPREPDA